MAVHELREGGTALQGRCARVPSLVRAVRHAVAERERRRLARVSARRIHSRQKGRGESPIHFLLLHVKYKFNFRISAPPPP